MSSLIWWQVALITCSAGVGVCLLLSWWNYHGRLRWIRLLCALAAFLVMLAIVVLLQIDISPGPEELASLVAARIFFSLAILMLVSGFLFFMMPSQKDDPSWKWTAMSSLLAFLLSIGICLYLASTEPSLPLPPLVPPI